jgi:hypothetical protein
MNDGPLEEKATLGRMHDQLVVAEKALAGARETARSIDPGESQWDDADIKPIYENLARLITDVESTIEGPGD